MVGRGGAQSHAGQGGLLRRRRGIANARGTEGEAPDSGACRTTMTELLVELTDGVVLHSQFTKLRFTDWKGKKMIRGPSGQSVMCESV